MKRRTNVWLARLGTYGWHARTTVLLPVLLVAYGLTGLLACWLDGPTGLLAATLAVLICLFAGFASGVSYGVVLEFRHLLLGMGLRTGIPLVLLLLVYIWLLALIEAGMIYCLLAHYGAMLAVQTVLLVARVHATAGTPKVS